MTWCARAGAVAVFGVLLSASAYGAQPAAPSTDFTTWVEGELIRLEIPTNWRELLMPGTVTFAPDGAYGQVGGSSVFTHGVAIGLANNDRHDLERATSDFIEARFFGGHGGDRRFRYRKAAIGPLSGVGTTLTDMSLVSGELQRVEILTVPLRSGALLYVLTISPVDAEASYAAAFRHVVHSIAILGLQ